MLVSTGTLTFAGGLLKNPYIPRDTDPVDRAPVQHPGPKVSPFAALKRTPAPGVQVQITNQATSAAANQSFASALPVAQSAASAPKTSDIVTGGQVSPRLSLQAQVGNDRSIGTADLFLPFYQTSDSIAYFDLRGIATTQEEFEGNLGVGYRQVVGDVLGEEAVVGGYAFFDVRQSQFDNTYYQGVAGLEFLTDTVEARINGYLPNRDENVIQQGGSFVGLVGTTVTTLNVANIVEKALPGFDAEIGFNVDLSDQLRANITGGYFHFQRDDVRANGPKARLELSYADPLGLDGAVLTFGGEFRNDQIRDTEANGFLRLSIPLSSNPRPARELSPRARKLGRFVYRDVDILAPAVADESNRAPDEAVLGAAPPPNSADGTPTAEGETINVFHVANEAQGDADCSDAANACTAAVALSDPDAGAGDFFVPVDVAGDIFADFDLFADLQSIIGQDGSGSVTLLIPDEAGSLLTLGDLGGRPTIEGTIQPANGSTLANFDARGGRAGAILVDRDLGLGTVRVQDVDIVGGLSGFMAERGAQGAITFDSQSLISGVEGSSVVIAAQTFEATFNNPIEHTGFGSAVGIFGHQNGTIEFNNTITADGQQNDLIALRETGSLSAVVFNEDLDLSLVEGTAFSANSVSGSLSIADDATVAITTERGQAVQLDTVTIGASGAHFDDIIQTDPESTTTPVSIQGTSGGLIDLGDVSIAGTTSLSATGEGVDGIELIDTANTITASSITADDISGDALVIRGATSLVAIDTVDIDGAGQAGILFQDVTGSAVIADGTIGAETSNGEGVVIDGGAPDLTIGADIATDGGLGVQVSSLTGGDVSVTGAITAEGDSVAGVNLVLNSGGNVTFADTVRVNGTDGASTGIIAFGNAGSSFTFDGLVDIDIAGEDGRGASFFINNLGVDAAFRFNGGLDILISGQDAVAFGASGGGVFEIAENPANRIVATDAVALSLAGVDIGTGGFHLAEITVTDAPRTPVLIGEVSGGDVTIDSIAINGVEGGSEGMVIEDSASNFLLGTVDIQNASDIGLVLAGANGDVTIDELNLNGNGFFRGFPFEDALLIEGATNDVTINSGNIGADAANGFNMTIAEQAASSTITFRDFDILADDDAGPLLIFNAGTIAFENVQFEQAGLGEALNIVGGTSTITADAASEIINRSDFGIDALAITSVEGGEISIAADISHQGNGDVVDVESLLGGSVSLTGDITALNEAAMEISGVADGASIEIAGDVSIEGASGDAIVIEDVAEGGSVRFTDAGLVSVKNAGDDGIDLERIAGVVAFDGAVTIETTRDHGLSVDSIEATGLVEIAGGLSISGTGGDAVDIENTIDGSLAIDGLDITLTEDDTTGVDISGASVDGGIAITGLIIQSESTVGTIGIDIKGTTGDGAIQAGAAPGTVDVAADESASISGVAIGVEVASDTDITFIYGDGENSLDTGSTIDAIVAIASGDGVLPTEGTYNFLDVDFAAPPSAFSDVSNLQGVRIFYVDQDGANPDSAFAPGTVQNPGSIAEAQAATDVDAIVLLDTNADGQIDPIIISSLAQGAGTSLSLDEGQLLLGFASGDARINLADFGLVADSLTPPFLFTGVESSTVLEAPEGIDQGPLLTSDIATGAVVEVAGSAGIANVTIVATQDADAVVASGFTGPSTLTIMDTVVRADDGTGVSVAAGGQDVDVVLSDLQVDSAGGTAMDLDGSATGTLTVNAFEDITVGRGATVITGVEFDAVTGAGTETVSAGVFSGEDLILTEVTGALDFDQVDIDAGNALGLAVSGGDDGFALAISAGSVTGSGIDVEDVALDVTLDAVTLGSNGLELDEVSGTLDILDGTITSTNSQTAIDIGGNGNGSGGNAAITIGPDITNSSGRSVLIQELSGGSVSITGTITDTGDGILVSEINNGTPAAVTFGDIDITNGGIEFRDNDDGLITITGNTTVTATDGGPTGNAAIEFDDNAGTVDVQGTVLIDGTVDGAAGIGISGAMGTITFADSVSITGTAGDAIRGEGTAPITGSMDFADLDIELSDENTVALDLSNTTLTGAITADDFDVTAVIEDLSSDSLQTSTLVFDGAVSRNAEIIPHDPVFEAPAGAVSIVFEANSVDGLTTLLSKDSNGFDDGGHLTLFVEDGLLRLRAQTETESLEIVGGVVVPGTEQVVEVSWIGTLVTLTLDGEVIGTAEGWTGLAPNLEPIVLGASQARSGDGIANRLRNFFDGEIRATDFIVRTAEIAGTGGVDLSGTEGGGTVRLGAEAASDNGASVGAGVAFGIGLSDSSDVLFTFGDGESATGQASRLNSVIQINAPTPPTNGTYNFVDVDFGAVTRNVFPDAGGDIVFVAANETGDGSGRNVDNRATIATADAITREGVTFALINDGTIISHSGTFSLSDGQNIDGFGNGQTFTIGQDVPDSFLGVPGAESIQDDPTDNGAAILTATLGSATQRVVLAEGDNQIANIIIETGIGTGIGGSGSSGERIELGSDLGALIVRESQGVEGNAGVNLSNASADIVLTNLEIEGQRFGLLLTNMRGDVDLDRVIIRNTSNESSGRGLNITSNSDDLVLADEPSDILQIIGGLNPLEISRNSGDITIGNANPDQGAGFSVSGATGTVFQATGNTGNIILNGEISSGEDAFVRTVLVDLNEGDITFNGKVTATGATQTQVGLFGPTGTVTFAGGLDITTTTGTGLFARDGASVVVTGTGNRITTGNRQALVLNGVTADVTFDAINTTNTGQDSVQLTNVDGSVTINGGTLSTVVNGTGFASIDVLQDDEENTRALALTVNNVTFTQDASATSGGEEDGIRARTAGDDSLVLSINESSFATEDFGVSIAAVNGLTTVTGFANNTLLGSDEADRPFLFQNGVRFAGVTFDADLETDGLQAVQGGTFTAGTAATRVANGLLFTRQSISPSEPTAANQGEIAFTDYAVFAEGIGLLSEGANPDLAITIAGGTIDAGSVRLGGFLESGQSIAEPVNANITLNSLTLSTLSGRNPALGLRDLTGSFTVTGQTLITAPEVIPGELFPGFGRARGATVNALEVAESSADITFGSLLFATSTTVDPFPAGSEATTGGPTVAINLDNNSGGFTVTGLTSITDTVEDGIRITDTSGEISFAQIQVTNPGAAILVTDEFLDAAGIEPTPAAIDISGTITGAINLGDVDILLARDNTIGLDLGGATLNADVTADDFDVLANVPQANLAQVFDGTVGIQLAGTTTEQMSFVQIGDTVTGDGNGAVIERGIAIGVNLSETTAVNFAFGDGEGDAADDVDQASSLESVIQINAPTPPENGSYNFADVDFTNDGNREINNVFPSANTGLIFVGSAATGDGSGVDLDNLATIVTADANIDPGVTFVLVNDGTSIDDTDGFSLTAGQNLNGFGNGQEFNIGLVIPNTFQGVPGGEFTVDDSDQPVSGAATLTSSNATVLNLAGDNAVANIIIFGDGQNGIGMASATGDITLGSSDGALIMNGTGAGSAIDTAGLNGNLEIVDVRATGFDTGLHFNGFAGNAGAALDIDRLFLSSTSQNIEIRGTTGVLNLADEVDDALTLQGGLFGLRLSNASGTVNVGGNTTISGTTSAAIDVFGGSANLNFAGEVTDVGQGSSSHLVAVGGGHTGTLTFEAGSSLAATQGNGLQFDNADGTYNFNGTTTLNGTGAGIDIFNGSAGTFTFGENTSITMAGGTAFQVNEGTANVTYNGNITKTGFGNLVNIFNHQTGTITFQNGTLSATSGPGIDFNSSSGTYEFLGTTTLNAADMAIDILNSDGDFTFGAGTSLTHGFTSGFQVSGGQANVTYSGNLTTTGTGRSVRIGGHSVGTVTFDTGTIGTTTGSGIQLSDASGTYNFNGTTTLNGGDAGIDIVDGSTGTFTFGSNTSITDPSGTAFNVDGGAPTVTYNGTITQTNAASAVSIVQTTGGSVTFNGQVTGNTGAEQGVSLVLAESVTFAGGLDLTTTAGVAVFAATVDELNITGTGNTLTSEQNPITLNTVEIGAGGVTFDTISGANLFGSGLQFSGITGGTFSVTGTTTVTHSGNTGAAIDFRGTTTATFDFADVDITQTETSSANPVGISIAGALTGSIIMRDLDMTFADSAGSIGVDLQLVTGGGTVTLGDPAMLDGASIAGAAVNPAGPGVGVQFSDTTNVVFTFGDGEGANDTGSSITAATPIGGTLPENGSYNFQDVVFAGDISNLTGALDASLFFVDPIANNGTGAEGTITNPGSFSSANSAQNVDIFIILAESDAGPNTLTAGSVDHPGNTLSLDSGQSVFGFSTVDANGNTVTLSEIDLATFGVGTTAGAPDSFSFTGLAPVSTVLANPFTTHAEISSSGGGSSIAMGDDTVVKGVSFAAGSPVNQAISVGSRSNVLIEDVTIRDFSDFGIALFNLGGTNAIRNSVISTNDASAEGIRVLRSSGTLEITDVLFKTADNPVNGLNRAVLVDNAFQSFDSVLDLTMTNVDVEGLRTGSGNAIFDIIVDDADGGSVIITESDLVGTNQNQRGFFFRSGGALTGAFTDITFSNNRMTGVYTTGTEINLGSSPQATLDRITVAGNSFLGEIGNGGGIRLFLGSDSGLAATTAVGNVSIAGNTVGTADQRSQSRGIQYFQRTGAVGPQVIEIRDNVLFAGDGTSTGDTAIEVFVDGTGTQHFAFSDNQISLIGPSNGSLEALIFNASSVDPDGSVTITEFSGTTFGEGNVGGVEFFGQDQRPVIFDADPDTAGFQVVNIGDFRLGTATARVTSDGLNLDDVIGNIAFEDLDIFTGNFFALRTDHRGVAADLTVTINADGQSDPTLDSAGNRAFILDSVTLNATFADVTGSGGFFRDVASGTGVVFGGVTTFDNALGGSTGVLFFDRNTANITFADLRIALTQDGRRGIDFAGASRLDGDLLATAFTLTSESAVNTVGIDLSGLTGSGAITLGDPANAGSDTPSSIGGTAGNAAGTGTGIAFNSVTDILFTFGDGEEGEDALSSITATSIIGGTLPVGGQFNLLDVGTLTGDTSNLVVEPTVFFVDQDQAGVGTLADPGSIAGANAFSGEVIALIDTDVNGNQNQISTGTTLHLDEGQVLVSLARGESIDLTEFGFGGAPANFQFAQAAGLGGGAGISIDANDLTVDTVRPLLDATGNGILMGNGGVIGVDAQAGLVGINATQGSAAGDIVIRDVNVRSLNSIGINIAPGSGARNVKISDVTATGFGNSGPSDAAIRLSGGVTVSEFTNVQLGASNPGGIVHGLLVESGVTFDADPGTAEIEAVQGGSFTFGSAATPESGVGIEMDGVSGAIAFDSIDIFNTGQRGIDIITPNAFSLSAGNSSIVNSAAIGEGIFFRSENIGSALTFTGDLTLQVNDGRALRVDTSGATTGGTLTFEQPGNVQILSGAASALEVFDWTVNGQIDTLSITSLGNRNGVEFQRASGTLDIAGGLINKTDTGKAFQIGSTADRSGGDMVLTSNVATSSAGSTGGATFEIRELTGGSLTFSNNHFDDGGAGGGILLAGINNGTGATVNFTGTTHQVNTGATTAVDLSNNQNGTINFTNGGLGITTTTGIGFRAVNGGVVTVEDGVNGNTILVTGSGQAVLIENTTIGANGAHFRAINRFTRAATNGITLDNTGTTGAFVVDSKSPNTGFGGTINTTGGSNVNPLAVTGSAIVNIRGMVLDSDDGIAARFAQTGSDQLTYNLVGNTFRGANGLANEGTVDFQNSGNSVVQGRFLDNVVEHRNRPNPQPFFDEFASGLTVQVSQSGSHTIQATGNTFNNESALTGGAAFNGPAANFLVAASGPGTLNVTFENNTINGGSTSSTVSYIQFGTLNNSPGTACGNFANNRVNVTAFSGNDDAFFVSSQGSNAVQLAGSGASVEQNWINQGNQLLVNGAPFAGAQTGSTPGGSFTFNATCSVPTHPTFP